MRDVYQLPATPSAGAITELADGTRRYRKMLVKFGSYVDPRDPTKKMVLDKSWAGQLIENFQKHITHAPVVEGHPKTSAELLAATRGDLDGMTVDEKGLYGDFSIKKPETADAIDDGLAKDVSVSFNPNYQDKATGDFIGPLLRHVGLVNDPYITGMEPFQALADDANVIMLSEESKVSKLKNDKEYAVKVTVGGKEVEVQPGAELEVPEAELEAVTKQVTEAVKPEPTEDEKKAQADKEAADAKAAEDKVKADKEAADKKAAEDAKNAPELSDREKAMQVELSETKAKLATRDAEDAYTKLLKDGKIVPAQKDAFLALSTSTTTEVSLSDGTAKPLSELLTNLIEAGPKRISFSEDGRPLEGDPTPFDQLSDGEKKATTDMGITADEYNKTNSTVKASESKKDDDGE